MRELALVNLILAFASPTAFSDDPNPKATPSPAQVERARDAAQPHSPQRRDRRGQRQEGAKYSLGPLSLPQPGVPQGRLEGPFTFHSKILENTTRLYWIYVPAQYDASHPACVLVFQDGARATDPNHTLHVPQVLENLIARQEIPVTIGVFISPGQRGDFYPEDLGLKDPDNRSVEYDTLSQDYGRFLLEEMLPEVEKRYKLTHDPRGRVIGGTSSGAICAFNVAWEFPDEFRNVISFIGSFTDIRGGHVYPDRIRESETKPLRVFLQDGIYDLRNPDWPERDWYLQNKKMDAALMEKGYDSVYILGEGGHRDMHGGAMLPYVLQWIFRDYPGVKPPEQDPIEAARAVQPSEPAPEPLLPQTPSRQ